MTAKKPTLVDIIVEFLTKRPGKLYTAREIAGWIYENEPSRCQQKKERSKAVVTPLDTEEKMIQQLAAEIGAQATQLQKRKILITETRPKKYYLGDEYYFNFSGMDHFEKSDEVEQMRLLKNKHTEVKSLVEKINKQLESNYINFFKASNPNMEKAEPEEADLYPILDQFLRSQFNIYCKRIDEKRSRNSKGKNGNKWLHPDLVAIENLSADWHATVKECAGKINAVQRTRFWSFEVKLVLTHYNLRENFFQAVSNSSWANFGYLVAGSIAGSKNRSETLLQELRILSKLHGIGFILLDTADPSESQIVIPAQEKSHVDWDTANRLASENTDFQEYLEAISRFYATDHIHEQDWKVTNNKKKSKKDTLTS